MTPVDANAKVHDVGKLAGECGPVKVVLKLVKAASQDIVLEVEHWPRKHSVAVIVAKQMSVVLVEFGTLYHFRGILWPNK